MKKRLAKKRKKQRAQAIAYLKARRTLGFISDYALMMLPVRGVTPSTYSWPFPERVTQRV